MELILKPGAITALSLTLGLLLVLAARYLRVDEDPRIDRVEELLPHANCGACGEPGCRAFAEALVAGRAAPGACTVSDDAGRARVAAFLGVATGQVRREVARLACAGGANVARFQAAYSGVASCRAAQQVSGAGKGCVYGCLGFGDCEVVCDFDAIRMSDQGLPEVIPALCVACGDCVDVCPRDLFEILPEDRRLFVACRSFEAGDAVLDECAVGCTACGKCAFDLPGVVAMDDETNLPVVAAGTSVNAHREAIQRCPTGAIVWFDDEGRRERGREAARIARKSALPVMEV